MDFYYGQNQAGIAQLAQEQQYFGKGPLLANPRNRNKFSGLIPNFQEAMRLHHGTLEQRWRGDKAMPSIDRPDANWSKQGSGFYTTKKQKDAAGIAKYFATEAGGGTPIVKSGQFPLQDLAPDYEFTSNKAMGDSFGKRSKELSNLANEIINKKGGAGLKYGAFNITGVEFDGKRMVVTVQRPEHLKVPGISNRPQRKSFSYNLNEGRVFLNKGLESEGVQRGEAYGKIMDKLREADPDLVRGVELPVVMDEGTQAVRYIGKKPIDVTTSSADATVRPPGSAPAPASTSTPGHADRIIINPDGTIKIPSRGVRGGGKGG